MEIFRLKKRWELPEMELERSSVREMNERNSPPVLESCCEKMSLLKVDQYFFHCKTCSTYVATTKQITICVSQHQTK